MKIAMAQMLVEGGRPRQNLERARDAIERAGAAGAQVIVLPECLDFGWLHPSAREAPTIPGEHSEFFSRAARDVGIVIVAGITERDGSAIYNSAVLLDATGRLLRRHRKISELDFAQQLYTVGSSLEVVDSDLGRIGLCICADLSEGSELIGHALGHMRAQVILSPSAWAVPPEHDNAKEPYGAMWLASYTGIAKRYGVPVIGVSNVGTIDTGHWKGWRCIGDSLAVGADGSVIARGPHGDRAEALLFVEVAIPPPGPTPT